VNYRRNPHAALALWLLACASVASSATAGPAESAREILNATGIRAGLIVHVGCGDGALTAALRANDSMLVHGLDADARKVQQARASVRSRGLYGQVAVAKLGGDRLPYADNLVNLVVSEDLGAIRKGEVMRVLRPGGKAYVRHGGEWTLTVKPWPDGIDEWTHFLHGPDNNAVARDKVVGPPRHMQWVGAPKFARAHEQLASLSACVTAAGRLFYIIDEAPVVDIRLPSRFVLVARDAFNGVVLWKRPLADWAEQLRRFRAGPPDLPFRLAVEKDRVYVTLGIHAPVSILDAASGKTLQALADTEGARQVLRIGEKLIVLVDSGPQNNAAIDSQIRRGLKPAPGVRKIDAFDASSGERAWTAETRSFVQPTLAAQGQRLLYQTTKSLHCLDLATGNELWTVPMPMSLKGHELGWESPTLVVQDGVAYSADFKRIVATAVEDGRELWSRPASPGYNSPPDVLLIEGLVWTKGKGLARLGLDPRTGEVKKTVSSPKGYMHARCYRNKATERFILLGNQGTQFLDVESGESWLNYWLRGTCQYGVLPANGLLYVTPDSCACNLKVKLNGFWALASTRQDGTQADEDGRLETGPAYSKVIASKDDAARDWPTYRSDAARRGAARTSVEPKLERAWKVRLGGKLSSVTSAAGLVFIASVDTHTIHALSAESGACAWTFTAGARVDSPPTYSRGSLLFGSADGWVYSLRAQDGELAWRYRAAPKSRLVFANGQLESAWPVHGSILVRDDEVIVAAGRSSYIDGGIHLHRLELATGRKIASTVLYSPEEGKQPKGGGKELRGLLSDVLLDDGKDVFMRHVKLDLETGDETGAGRHLFSPVGLLDDTWWHRGYWVVNDKFLSHWSAWWKVGNQVPSGRILVHDDNAVYGYGRDKYPGGNTGQFRGGEKYQLFACDRDAGRQSPDTPAAQAARRKPAAAKDAPESTKRAGKKGRKKKRQPAAPAPGVEYRWTRQVPVLVRAMVLSGDAVFVAGPPDVVQAGGASGEAALVIENPAEVLAAWQGRKGGSLLAVSRQDGKTLARYDLESPPIADGMAAARGRLFFSTMDGDVECWAGR